MGGGHVTRPDFGKSKLDLQNPMSEFYELFLQSLEKSHSFAVPGCYVRFKPDLSRRIYREDMPQYCAYSPQRQEGAVMVIEEGEFLYDAFELSLTAAGEPAAVFLLDSAHRRQLAVRLLPPFGGVELPRPPGGELIELQLCAQDLMLIDEAPAKLGAQWVKSAENKRWAASEKIEAFELKALAAAQKEYRRLTR